MRADSLFGSTCWWCGHGGFRTRKEGDASQRCCQECKFVKGTRAEVQAKLNADVEGLKHALRGGSYTPVYWSQAVFESKFHAHRSYPVEILDKLKWIEFNDALLDLTKKRQRQNRAEYQKKYYTEGGKEARKEYYNKRVIATQAQTEKAVNELLEWEKENGKDL